MMAADESKLLCSLYPSDWCQLKREGEEEEEEEEEKEEKEEGAIDVINTRPESSSSLF